MDSMSVPQTQSYQISSRKRAMAEDEAYFDDDEDISASKLEYIPAAGSPGAQARKFTCKFKVKTKFFLISE